MKSKFLLQKIIVLAFLLYFPFITYAQFNPRVTATISSTPAYPGPNESVTLRLESFFISLDGSLISWRQGNSVLKEGIGATSVVVKTGELGEKIAVEAFITEASGRVSVSQITITPTDIDLIWEADGYTPYFYKGKALPIIDSTVRFIALPYIPDENGNTIPESNLIYTWKYNGKALQDRSGYGKQTLILPTSPRSMKVEIEVSKRTGERVAHAQTVINPVDPEILVYKNDPLLGIIEAKEVGTAYTDTGSELTLSLFPFYFPQKDVETNALEYNWYMNSSQLFGKTQDITVRKGERAGQSQFRIIVKNNMSFFQEVEKLFTVRLVSNE